MTAQLLPRIPHSPFSKHFDQKPYEFQDVHSFTAVLPDVSQTSLPAILNNRARQASPASILTVASAPALPDDENTAPKITGKPLHTIAIRSFSANSAAVRHGDKLPFAKISQTIGKPKKAWQLADNAIKATPELRLQTQGQSNVTFVKASRDSTAGTNESPTTRAKARKFLETANTGSQSDSDCICSNAVEDGATKVKVDKLQMDDSVYGTVDVTVDLSPDSKRKRSLSSVSYETPVSKSLFPAHRKNLSAGSSGFVHSLKTASFTNASFSMLAKSLRFGRSSDSYALFGSYHRFSTDSDRPPTSSSLDEAALRRGQSRSQIIEELTATEESYIEDLKALVYMLSTLLASGTTISNRTRTSIQRNVLELLHLHENLLEQLHRASFKSAARRWADTISPRHLQSRYHRRLRSTGSNLALRLTRVDRLKRSSSDSFEMKHARNRISTADPADIADIVTIYRNSISLFFAYEEYCANHELIAYELHKYLPNLWSLYEGGMESLARSLVSLDRREHNKRKGITVGDLLIKPIQRVCKYPLLFEDLLRQTPAGDCPSAHSEVELTLQYFRDIAHAVNTITDNHEARFQIQRRWALQARLNFSRISFAPETFRLLGSIQLCGILHVTYQTRSRADGAYALCILFDSSFMVAMPAGFTGRFDVIAFIHLSDLKLDSASDGKGLQCQSAHYTWKMSFTIEGHLHEFLLSACSAMEEDQWKTGLRGEFSIVQKRENSSRHTSSSVALDLKSVGSLFGCNDSLTRRLSVQRAATIGNRANICQVIIRNTHNPQDLHEFRQPSRFAINRSQSHMTTNRIVVLAPKRSERARLENLLSDIWTKDKLPFPGMIASRGGQIIRASAGSLVRKLSLASIHAPFSRRSSSLNLSSRKSYETFLETKSAKESNIPRRFEVRKESFEEVTAKERKEKAPNDIPELDTMDRLVHRMIGDTINGTTQKPSTKKRRSSSEMVSVTVRSSLTVIEPTGPDDSARASHREGSEKQAIVQGNLMGRRKRWSNPIGMLKGLSTEGVRHMLYSTK